MDPQLEEVTIVAIGEENSGRSAFGNLFLNKKVFQLASDPYHYTEEVNSAQNIVDDKIRTYVNTPGTFYAPFFNFIRREEIFWSLSCWKHDINAIGIVIDAQHCYLYQRTLELLKYLLGKYNEDDKWNSVFIVFTRWFKDTMTDKDKEKARKCATEARKFANECIGFNANPEMPCFFVDAKEDLSNIDDETKQELSRLIEFVRDKKLEYK